MSNYNEYNKNLVPQTSTEMWLPLPPSDAVYIPASLHLLNGGYKANVRLYIVYRTDFAWPTKVILTQNQDNLRIEAAEEIRQVSFENADEVVLDMYIAGTQGTISPFMIVLIKLKHSNAYRANLFRDGSSVLGDPYNRLEDIMQVFAEFPNMTVNEFKAQVSIFKLERVPETNKIDLATRGLMLNDRLYIESLCMSKELLPSE